MIGHEIGFLPVLFIEVIHVRDEILDNIHVGKRVDLGGLVVGLDLGQAGKGVHASCKNIQFKYEHTMIYICKKNMVIVKKKNLHFLF